MASTFAVSALSPTVKLPKERRGSVPFTVTNTSGRATRGRAWVVPLNGAQEGWFTVAGEAERDFSQVHTFDYRVDISVPMSVPPGTYALRLDVAAEDRPNEDYTAGPVIALEVGPAVVEPEEEDPGYLTTIIGTAVGGLAGLAAGVILAIIIGVVLAAIADDIGDLIGALLVTMLLFIPGPWIGAAIGSWLALRMRRYRLPKRTGLIMAGVFPVWAVLTVLLLALLSNIGLEGVPLALVILLVMPPLWVVVPALASRWATLKLAGRQPAPANPTVQPVEQ